MASLLEEELRTHTGTPRCRGEGHGPLQAQDRAPGGTSPSAQGPQPSALGPQHGRDSLCGASGARRVGLRGGGLSRTPELRKTAQGPGCSVLATPHRTPPAPTTPASPHHPRRPPPPSTSSPHTPCRSPVLKLPPQKATAGQGSLLSLYCPRQQRVLLPLGLCHRDQSTHRARPEPCSRGKSRGPRLGPRATRAD